MILITGRVTGSDDKTISKREHGGLVIIIMLMVIMVIMVMVLIFPFFTLKKIIINHGNYFHKKIIIDYKICSPQKFCAIK